MTTDTTTDMRIHGQSVGLLTDLYQLTMAYGYWKSGELETEGVFNLTFRENPFKGGYSISCGLGYVIEFLKSYRFEPSDIEYLATLTGNDDQPLFESEFLAYLGDLELSCDVEAVPEGTVVFPQEPLLRVMGPLLQCQLLETPLLNMMNFQTLIATKASRICAAAQGDPVIEFGLRRAQGFDGAMAASRAAFIGGCDSTSNVLAARTFGIPPRGTHAHSWVMTFDSELEAFLAYSEAMPNNCILLVDTYDTLQGVRNAVEVGQRLRARGSRLAGIRLDSGDLAYLSIEARKILDAAGFADAVIVASNELNEAVISSLKDQGAAIDVWGVGTELVTALDQPALGAIYKLAAVRRQSGTWEPRIKLSEQAVKVNTPGVCQVRRFRVGTEFIADMIYDEMQAPVEPFFLIDPMDRTRHKPIEEGTAYEDLLVPVARQGAIVYEAPSPVEARQKAREQLQGFHPSIRRFLYPHQYPVGLDKDLHDTKTALILAAREEVGRAAGRTVG
jgi:nicotinate phosphoribosyltransferase